MRIVRKAFTLSGVLALVLATASAVSGFTSGRARWSASERALLRSLALESLGPVPADPSNRHADDTAAARLGHELFFDVRLSSTQKVSCATCHMPDRDLQDGKPFGEGVGMTSRRTMPVAGTAHSPWQFWDGRADSQWAQALGPLESPVEHGGTRTQYAHLIALSYRDRYESVFGPMPGLDGLPRQAGPVADTAWASAWRALPTARQDEISRVYANIGKAIAAYERRIGFAPSRFDRYVSAVVKGERITAEVALSHDEETGLRLFIGKAGCVNCHNGALLTDNVFHNTGVPAPSVALPPDSGRATGVRQALGGEFSCTGPFSDAGPDDCRELRFAVTEGHELVRAFKTPSLRNVAARAPFMHAGQVATLADVLRHYNAAPSAPYGHSELRPLRLTTADLRQLEAFLGTLTSPLSAPEGFLSPPAGEVGKEAGAPAQRPTSSAHAASVLPDAPGRAPR